MRDPKHPTAPQHRGDPQQDHRTDAVLPEPHGEHEHSDVPVRPILYFAVGLAVSGVVIHLLMAWLFDKFAERARRADAPLSPLAELRQPPPEPRLQLAPSIDMAALRAQDQQTLGSYGWIVREAGLVRIPIERAMDLVAERGLPVRTGPAPVQPDATPQQPAAGQPPGAEPGAGQPPASGEVPGAVPADEQPQSAPDRPSGPSAPQDSLQRTPLPSDMPDQIQETIEEPDESGLAPPDSVPTPGLLSAPEAAPSGAEALEPGAPTPAAAPEATPQPEVETQPEVEPQPTALADPPPRRGR
jgi:hypothetical protein